MAYGFQVLNEAGRVIIDSNEGYSNDYCTETQVLPFTQAAFDAPPTGYQVGDSKIARPLDTTTVRYSWVSLNFYGNYYGHSSLDIYEEPVDGLVTALMRSQIGLNPAAGNGYGLEVFDSSGTNLIFTNDIPNMADVMQFGQIARNSAPITYTIPAGYDPTRFFVVVDATNTKGYTNFSPDGNPSWDKQGYRFDRWANPQTITVYNEHVDLTNGNKIDWYMDEMWYMIVYV